MKTKCISPFFGHFISTSVTLNSSVRTLNSAEQPELQNKECSFVASYDGGLRLHMNKLKNKKQDKIRRTLCASYSKKFCSSSVTRTKSEYNGFSLVRCGMFSSDKIINMPLMRRINSQTKKHVVNNTKIMSHTDVTQTQKSHKTPESVHSKDYSKLFLNCVFDKGRLKAFVVWFLQNYGQKKTIELLEQLKQIGFGYATKAGISLGIDDLKIPAQKTDLLINAQALIDEGSVQYKRGEITGVEKFQRLIDTWHQTSENLKQEVIRHFEATDLLNPVYMMAFSGARGNISQVRQLVGMRGLMADPQGQIIDFPIRSNFREGLTLTEYIISSYGARKGIVDTALRTANAGYLTRRLVDVAQHVIVSEFDCKTSRGILVLDMKEGNKTIYSFQNRLLGRVLAKDIFDKQQKIASKNQEVSADLANSIAKITKKALIRSPLTCETKKLVCQLCYGWSLSTSSLVSIGEAVGIIAAQSIGEPGTQLTMRTFHTGGVFSGGLSEQIIAQNDGIVEYSAPIPGICVRTPQGQIAFLTKTQGCLIFKTTVFSNSAHQLSSDSETPDSTHTKIWNIPPYTVLFARNKQKVFKKQIIAQLASFSLSGEIQKTPKGDAEQTIYSLFEGEIYNSNIDVIEKFNEYQDLTFEAWGWGYLWVLAGKIYRYPIQSYVFAQPGDFIGKNSVLNRIQWISSDKFFLNTNSVNSRESNLLNGLWSTKSKIRVRDSISYAQNEFTLSHNPRELEMEKNSNFFQPSDFRKKNMKMSILTRYEKKLNTEQTSYKNSKNLVDTQLNTLHSLESYSKPEKKLLSTKLINKRQSDFLKKSVKTIALNTKMPIVSTKIHSIRLIRTKFFRKKFDIDYWKFIDSSSNLVYYSNQHEQKMDLSNFHYPFHKFLRKRLSMIFNKKFAVSYKTHETSSTKTENSSHKNNLQKRNKANRVNRIHFLRPIYSKSRNIGDSNEKSKYKTPNAFKRNFRIPTRNQSDIFVSNQLTYLKRWKLLKSVYPYVNKKTIKTSIFSKLITFQKNRILLHDVTNKSDSRHSRKIVKLDTQEQIAGAEEHSFSFNLKTTLKNIFNVQTKSHFKTFNKYRKKQSVLTRLFASNTHIRPVLRNTRNKNNLILNESNLGKIIPKNWAYNRLYQKKNAGNLQIVQQKRNHKNKSDFNLVARHSKKASSIILKKPVLLLSLKNLRYRKLGYNFSQDFRPTSEITKTTHNIKPSLFSISQIEDANKFSGSNYSTKSPLNFGYYAPNKNKDEFFNKFSLKTSIDSLDMLRDKQNTYEWSPMYDSFLQWFPSCHQTLNNGIFIFSGIHLTSSFLFKTKNNSIFSSNKKKNIARSSQQTPTFRLNCYQFKRKSTSHLSTNKIHYAKKTKHITKQISSKLPILKNLKFNDVASGFSLLPKTTLRFEFNRHKHLMPRIKKKTVLVNQAIMHNYKQASNNESDSSHSHKTSLIEKQTESNLSNKAHHTNRIFVLPSNSGNKSPYSLHKAHKNFKTSDKLKKRHQISNSVVYSLNMLHLQCLKKSEHNSISNAREIFVYKSLHQMNLYDFKTNERDIGRVINSKSSTSRTKFTPWTHHSLNVFKKFKNQLRWKNKKLKLSVSTNSTKYFARVTKKNINRSFDFRKKPKTSSAFNTKYDKKSNFASFNPRSKFSVSCNEIFWIPQEDYQISVWPVSFGTRPDFALHFSENLARKSDGSNKNNNEFRSPTSTVESSDFMNRKSKPLFYLTNLQGLKKPFHSKLEGFSKIFIKPLNAVSSIELHFLLNNEQITSPLNSSNGVISKNKTNTTKNKSHEINTSNSMNLKTVIDFSQKSHHLYNNLAHKSIPKNRKQNAIHNAPNSWNKIHRNLKSCLMNFIKTKWQVNDESIFQNEKKFHLKKQYTSENDSKNRLTSIPHRGLPANDIKNSKNSLDVVIKPSSLYKKYKNKLLFFYYAQNKFVPKNTVYSVNAPITSSFYRQKNFFSHFVFQNLNLVKNALVKHNNGSIKQRPVSTTRSNSDVSLIMSDNTAFSSVMTVSDKNQMNLESITRPILWPLVDHREDYTEGQKMRISIQPGWVYYSLNKSNITKCHQKIVDFGKFVADDLLFTNHRVSIKNIVLKHSPVNIFFENSKYAQLSLDNNIAHKFENNMTRFSHYSFNLNDSVPFYSAQDNSIDEAFALDSCYNVNMRISNSKSRYGDVILKHLVNRSNTSVTIQNSDSKASENENGILSNIEQKQNAPKNFSLSHDSLAILIRPMQYKILPNLHFYKTKIYRANKKSLESNFSLLTYKNFQSHFLNKQKCDQKFIATFPGIDVQISSDPLHCALYPQTKKKYSMNHAFSKANQKADSKSVIFSNTRPMLATSKKSERDSFLSLDKSRFKNSIDQTSKNNYLFSKTTPLAFNVFSNKHHSFSNLFFDKTPVRHCFEQTYLALSPINFLPLDLKFSIPSSFHYLFKMPSFNFNSSTNMCFAEKQITERLGASSSYKFRSYVLTDLVLKNQRRLCDTYMHVLTKPRQSVISNVNSIEMKLCLDSLASSSFLPRFDLYLSAKMSYLANQRLFASYFNFRDFSSASNKNTSLLESFGNFPVSRNQICYFQSNKVYCNEPFAMTSLNSPLRGEMLFKPSKNWSSEADQNRCLILTESDLFGFYLPSIDTEVKTTTASNQQQTNSFAEFSTKKNIKKPNVGYSVLENCSEQTTFKNKFSTLYQNFLRLEQIHSDKSNEQKTTNPTNEHKKNDNIIVQYNKKLYKIKGLRIGAVKAYQKLRLGSFLVYGDLLSSNAESAAAIDQAGQIIHMNCCKVTFRRAQPISVSPKGILHAYNRDFIAQNAAVITLPFQTLKTGDIVQGIPKVEQYFEARTTKRGRLYRDSLPNLLQGLFERYRTLLPLEKAVRQSFLKIQQIIVDGVQRVYRSQGVSISDKHLEVVVRQMTSKVQIVHGGQTGFFPGELVDLEFVEHVNQFLLKKIYYEPVVLGITRASLEVESFLSAASFQQTTKVLSKAAVYRKKDFLKGLKENIIVGNLIPGGTGYLVHLKEFFNMRSK
uniref:DNA-directed RNA polymerase subunit beta'' n=1 Tax=Bracteacoccus giganteus TaxID=50039 RepID=A0A0S2LQ35_9CHLO|nr:beta'' subunit of RNA polymerase [Bracteacoccus giganteus]ALO63537.1 beta'' subunit of RNA polymerase [Bracteacoccus giganteus]